MWHSALMTISSERGTTKVHWQPSANRCSCLTSAPLRLIFTNVIGISSLEQISFPEMHPEGTRERLRLSVDMIVSGASAAFRLLRIRRRKSFIADDYMQQFQCDAGGWEKISHHKQLKYTVSNASVQAHDGKYPYQVHGNPLTLMFMGRADG